MISQSGDVLRGGVTLFALSLGMGTPLLAFGASAGKLLPRAGAWMNLVKAAFGKSGYGSIGRRKTERQERCQRRLSELPRQRTRQIPG